jgi:lipopolysaccharide/colanic/teichoic acid biosynthesis glycosyltransferase
MALVNRRFAPLWNGLSLDAIDDSLCDPVAADRSVYFRWKRMIDRVVGLALMFATLPVLAFLILAIRISSRGPAIYRQRRVGLSGRVFTMYKLRSMYVDAEAAGPQWANPDRDPRVTPLGHWLRRLHLDELPQVFNLVRGEMSLVGPRPERPEFVPVLAQQIPGYLDRLRVAPGITGLAQVNLPADTDLSSVQRKLTLDLEYIGAANMLMDVKLLACTALRLVGIKGARTAALLGVQRVVPAPDCTSNSPGSLVTPGALAAVGACPTESPRLANCPSGEEGACERYSQDAEENLAVVRS